VYGTFALETEKAAGRALLYIVVKRALMLHTHRGVVQLFNAVDQQQKRLESQLNGAGGSERKRDKVIRSLDKRAFIDILMGHSHSEAVDSPVKLEAEPKVRAYTQMTDLHCTYLVVAAAVMSLNCVAGRDAPYVACSA
jgi:hypothetical protein